MDDLARLLTLLALSGSALTILGAMVVWRLDEVRRIRRSFSRVLSAEPQPLLTARGRGTGIGFNLVSNQLAVTSDRGAWCLVYGIDELMGVELIVDRQVQARVFRNETRLPLVQLALPEDRVRMRFVFDDPSHPDFHVDLWRAGDDDLHGRRDAETALQDANQWMARMEAVLRRVPVTKSPILAPIDLAAQRPGQTIEVAPSPPLADDPDNMDQPWDDAELDYDPVDEADAIHLHRKS